MPFWLDVYRYWHTPFFDYITSVGCRYTNGYCWIKTDVNRYPRSLLIFQNSEPSEHGWLLFQILLWMFRIFLVSGGKVLRKFWDAKDTPPSKVWKSVRRGCILSDMPGLLQFSQNKSVLFWRESKYNDSVRQKKWTSMIDHVAKMQLFPERILTSKLAPSLPSQFFKKLLQNPSLLPPLTVRTSV